MMAESSNTASNNVTASEPSTSTAEQPFRSKNSIANSKKQNDVSKKCTKISLKSKTTQAATSQDASVNDIATQCEAIKLESDVDADAQKNKGNKRKNTKKKQRLKNLQLQINKQVDPAVMMVQSAPVSIRNPQMSQQNASVQELFKQQSGFFYSVRNSSYMDNMSHHPHYQFMQHNAQPRSYYLSPPHAAQIDQRSPQFLQNMMQHPLLSQSLPVDRSQVQSAPVGHRLVHMLQHQPNHFNLNLVEDKKSENAKSSSKHRQKNKNKDKAQTEETKFECYIDYELTVEGLKSNKMLEGVLRINPKQFQHAYVSNSDREEQDVLIDGLKNRNRALEGDIVVVELITDTDSENDATKQKKGKVVYIKEKVHKRTCIGALKLMADRNRQKALFVPRDHRIPRLNIPCTSWPDNFYNESQKYENTLFLAKIIDWNDTRFAIGIISCFIGQSGDMVTESKAILAQNDLDVSPFGPEVRHLYPRLDFKIPEDEIAKREDCRNLCLFSIDPYNCRDIDDAVSCRELENGNYEIGVHISDVSYFLTEDTILDEKVSEKATTVYLVDKAYHMLPDDLCMLCSLFPGVDKLAFSVFWEITKDAKVLSHRFAKTVIHSCCQLSYEHAQAVLDKKNDAQNDFPEIYNKFKFEDVKEVIQIIGQISATFRKNRFDGGALRIDQPKVSFHLSAANGMPESFWIYESKESHQLIEEFMLLANMTVANKIYEDFPELAFLRCHPPPSGFMLKQLAKALKPMGIELNISSAGHLHRSLLPYVSPENEDRGKAMVLSMLCAKPMTRAKYFCAHGCDDEDFQHYALNVPLYTHFTSPIRRYADIMVHRLLAASLKHRDVPNWQIDKVKGIAAQCNKQKYNAKKAGEMSTELYTLKYIELHSPMVVEAVVVEVKEKYIDVIIVAMGLNRRIFLNNDFPGDFKCVKNEAGTKLSKMEVTWKATNESPEVKQVIEVFSILKVNMQKGDDMVKVETKLMKPS